MILQSVLVAHLEDGWLQLNLSLHYVRCSIENNSMLLPVVSPLVPQGTKLFEVSIDCLMPSSCHIKHVLPSSVVTIRSEALTVLIFVDAISNKHLFTAECLVQTISANAQVSPPSCRIRTIDPNNPSSLDADPTMLSKLVRQPLATEWTWFVDQAVYSIDCNFAD